MLKLDKKYENQIFEVGEIVSHFKTIEDLLDHAVLSTMNWDSGDGTVGFNYKDICGTIYEQSGYLQIGDEFELYNGDEYVCEFSKVNIEVRMRALIDFLSEKGYSEPAYILEDIMKEL